MSAQTFLLITLMATDAYSFREHEKRMMLRNSKDGMNNNNEAAKSLANTVAFSASIAIMTLMSQAMN